MKNIFLPRILRGLVLLSLSIFSVLSSAENNLHLTGVTVDNLPNMLEKVMPSVVNISAQGEINPMMELAIVPNNPQNEGAINPHDMRPRQFESLGSGVIVDAAKRLVLTNAHVISNAKTITVTLSDGRKLPAKLIGADPLSDIAVLQINTNNLRAIPFGDSDHLRVGEFVAAIGNPFGLNQTVTTGIVSGLQRNKLGIESFENFIQTNASINPGNSGGALVNQKGELIGINTAILGPNGNIGIGFAIPANMAKSLMLQLIQYGSIQRGLIGVMAQDLTPDLADAFGMHGIEGAVVTFITPSSPAEKAGIKIGDIIQSINDKKIKSFEDIRNMVGLLRVGSSVNINALRNKKTIQFKIATADPKIYQQENIISNPFLYGLGLKNFEQVSSVQGHIKGVQILHVKQDSAAWRAGLRPHDIIVSANNTPTFNIEQLMNAAKKDNHQLLVNIFREGAANFVVIK
ncbi:MAG: Periplasmic serine endoprotease DegP [Legionellaceae bacterium]